LQLSSAQVLAGKPGLTTMTCPPRAMAVTSPASTFCQPTNTTFAVLHMASAASIMATRPPVSPMPTASPMSAEELTRGILRLPGRETNRRRGFVPRAARVGGSSE